MNNTSVYIAHEYDYLSDVTLNVIGVFKSHSKALEHCIIDYEDRGFDYAEDKENFESDYKIIEHQVI